MGLLDDILAKVDNVKRVAKRNLSDLISDPADYGAMVAGRLKEQNAKLASKDPEAVSDAVANLIPGGGLGGGVLGTVVGAEAKYSSQQILNALRRLSKGEDAKKIFEETGIYKGPVDQAPRAHISDSSAKIKIDSLTTNQFNKELLGVPYGSNLSLPDLLDHPELFAAVPELKDVKIRPNLSMESLGSYNPKTNSIQFSATTAENAQGNSLSTLLHEVQHAIQNVSGFTSGGNTGQFIADAKLFKDAKHGAYTLQAQKQSEKEALKEAGKDTGNVDDFLKAIQDTITQFQKVESDAFDSYLRIGGEAEARAVQAQHRNEVFSKNFQGPEQRFIFNKVAPYKDSNFPLDFYDLPLNELIGKP